MRTASLRNWSDSVHAVKIWVSWSNISRLFYWWFMINHCHWFEKWKMLMLRSIGCLNVPLFVDFMQLVDRKTITTFNIIHIAIKCTIISDHHHTQSTHHLIFPKIHVENVKKLSRMIIISLLSRYHTKISLSRPLCQMNHLDIVAFRRLLVLWNYLWE